ncbi:MAG: [FeFe] hydrogenase, group A [Bacteroidetes bacterium]|nr:[FeFe] hydrogenase, group A [Bacteroidota bacterium]MBU1579216.1 [FeFe] hydrogenase, group A [Bacteroidota bacterium]MBU2556253.1 [FeFe] hydrogenase, group A [Bacteroidota bacterium]
MNLTIEVNNNIITANQGDTILDALSQNGMTVPTLCHMKGLFPTGACRMCVVEVEGRRNLVTACSEPVLDGMKIKTHSARVIESRKTIVELLLSNHPDDCLYCERNGSCELQDLSEDLHIRERRISGQKNKYKLDVSSASIVRDPAKCILCGRCVRVCEEIEGVSAIEFVGRGSKTFIDTSFNHGLNLSTCVNCGQCIMVCPTGALKEKDHISEIKDMLAEPEKTVVVQYAPSISVSLAEEFGLPSGQNMIGLMNAALRRMGFNYVFDTSFSADLTIMEEASELVHRVQNGGKLPMITSCCPGWVKYAEEFQHDMIENLSSCKSPQQMMGAIIKSYFAETENIAPENIYSVSIMPCTAKKFEQQREEMIQNGISDVDAVLTTRELARMIRLYGIDITKMEPELADSPLGTRSSAGKIFGTSGGVMEAAIRSAHYFITGKEMVKFQVKGVRGLEGRKEAKVNIGEMEVGVVVVSGLKNAEILMEEIRNGRNDIHFIEVMACPGGCINGGGQPIGTDDEAIKARMLSLYDIDEKDAIKMSHKNPYIKELYDKFLGKPLGHKSHELLHTHYQKRDIN